MTYRKSFASIVRPSIPKEHQCVGDSGWGCMLRSGQMLLANSLMRHLFGNEFSLKMLEDSKENRVKYLSVLMEFMDNLKDSEAAFSIGNVVEIGLLKYKMTPKNWYGPSIIASILSQLNNTHKPFKDLKTLVFTENTVYLDQLTSPDNFKTTSLLVFVVFRLGLKSIDPSNYQEVIRLLDLPQCTGMIGGQVKGALYFVGHQDNELIFLDPHVVQNAVEKLENLWAEHLSYHYSTPLKLAVDKVDTCICYGFYLKDNEECKNFINALKEEAAKEGSFVEIHDKEPEYNDDPLIAL
eukprot:TRINITY_DN9345_c0_g2_i7.p1 TRINITY_DN9345_c0_g2~~TRINITY_DN9345_c0_g2_i7.p1  ORF type:complete len:295 (-),score=64.41 TRINITY_DN9345_c0_g2_i7:193-1077(-)